MILHNKGGRDAGRWREGKGGDRHPNNPHQEAAVPRRMLNPRWQSSATWAALRGEIPANAMAIHAERFALTRWTVFEPTDELPAASVSVALTA